ncbi:hypothetical protein BB14905_01460, partial [Bacillus sp. B14905]
LPIPKIRDGYKQLEEMKELDLITSQLTYCWQKAMR